MTRIPRQTAPILLLAAAESRLRVAGVVGAWMRRQAADPGG